MSDAPTRAVVLRAKIDGHTRRDVANALYNLAREIDAGYILGTSVSGGVDSGWIVNIQQEPGPSRDAYFAELDAWLADRRAADTTTGEHT